MLLNSTFAKRKATQCLSVIMMNVGIVGDFFFFWSIDLLLLFLNKHALLELFLNVI